VAEPRIAVYAIALNEERHARRFVEAAQGADLVLVADTGSRDGTVGCLEAAGAVVPRIAVRPWRFDDARNAALALVPGEIDICLALDLDEILSPGWADAVRRAWTPGATRGRYLHVWTHRPDGSPDMHYIADRAHARHGYRWRHACHEAVYPDRIEERGVRIEGMQVDHWPDLEKSRGHYLGLLEATRDEDPDCSRNCFNLGREYRQHSRFEDAERELRRYLSLPASNWPAQNSAAMRHLAACRQSLGDDDGALDWYRRATVEAPLERDAWVALARALYKRGDWQGCFDALRAGLDLAHHPSSAISEPECAGHHPYDLASISAWRLGRIEEAARYAARAAELAPADERLARNVHLIGHRLGLALS
jgi:hypothetical protein